MYNNLPAGFHKSLELYNLHRVGESDRVVVVEGRLILRRLLDAKFQFDRWATLAAVALTALLANACGWLASFRILGQKPLDVLREE